jgi:hypothetical protein
MSARVTTVTTPHGNEQFRRDAHRAGIPWRMVLEPVKRYGWAGMGWGMRNV